jgi:hypothetical protein
MQMSVLFCSVFDIASNALRIQAEKRIWIIDSQASAIAHELRHDLGDWLLRAHRTNIKRHQVEGRADIEECKTHTSQQLWEGWEDQRATLKSVRTRM